MKTVNFTVTTVRRSNSHGLIVTECPSFSFPQKHSSCYTYLFNQDTQNISLAKTVVLCVAWVLTPCDHVWHTAIIRNKQYESINNPIYALCYRQFMTYISTSTCSGTAMPSSANHYNRRIQAKVAMCVRFPLTGMIKIIKLQHIKLVTINYIIMMLNNKTQ